MGVCIRYSYHNNATTEGIPHSPGLSCKSSSLDGDYYFFKFNYHLGLSTHVTRVKTKRKSMTTTRKCMHDKAVKMFALNPLHLYMTTLGVLCCFALFVCLTLLASFFLPSHLSLKICTAQKYDSQK